MALADSYRGFIFDFGCVLVKPQPESAQAEMADYLRIAPEKFHTLYWAKRADYDKGALTAEDYWQDIASQGGAKKPAAADVEKLVAIDAAGWMHFDEPMWDWLSELRKTGKRLAILSNMPRELGEALKTQTDRLSAFDFVVLSYEAHLVKPDAAIYEYTLDGLGTEAAETIFFDDRMENVQAAEQLGIRAIQFLDRDHVLLQVK